MSWTASVWVGEVCFPTVNVKVATAPKPEPECPPEAAASASRFCLCRQKSSIQTLFRGWFQVWFALLSLNVKAD